MTDKQEQETVDDIAAEMLDFATVQEQYRCGGADCDVVDPCWIAKEYANRIKAAVKRERIERHEYELEECSRCKSGNIAALREALEKCRDYFYDLLRSELFDAQTVQQTGNPTMDHVKGEQRLYEEIAAALSAPPRNCDLFNTAEEALAGHDRAAPLIRTGEPGMKEWKWAFAPAKQTRKEKERGAE